MNEKEVLQHPACKKYRNSFLNDIKVIRSYLIGSCLYTFINRLNPLTWLFFAISFLIIPIYCLFENTTFAEQYGYLFKMMFKGKV